MKVSLRDLILSVGTHKGSRPLSPLEVADGLAELTNELGFDAALEKLTLDPSTARRFLKLRELEPAVGELVDWGRKAGTISFSSAAEIGRLRPDQQSNLANACLRYGLTKEETRQVVQLVLRRRDDVDTAVDAALKMRPSITTIYVVVGAVRPELSGPLASLSQRDRDALLRKALEGWSGRINPGRLTSTNFSVTSSDSVSNLAVTEIEDSVNAYLIGFVTHQDQA